MIKPRLFCPTFGKRCRCIFQFSPLKKINSEVDKKRNPEKNEMHMMVRQHLGSGRFHRQTFNVGVWVGSMCRYLGPGCPLLLHDLPEPSLFLNIK